MAAPRVTVPGGRFDQAEASLKSVLIFRIKGVPERLYLSPGERIIVPWIVEFEALPGVMCWHVRLVPEENSHGAQARSKVQRKFALGPLPFLKT